MSAPYDYGPLQPYEVIWKSGHVETIYAHLVAVPGFSLFGQPERTRLLIHGMVDGHWRLILDADYADISSERLVTEDAERAS